MEELQCKYLNNGVMIKEIQSLFQDIVLKVLLEINYLKGLKLSILIKKDMK